MTTILRLNFDPLNDNIPTDEKESKYDAIIEATRVHVRVVQRTNWKRTTTCEGLSEDLNFGKVVRALRKNLSCNVAVKRTQDHGTVLQLQGKHAEALIAFLVETGLCLEKYIKVHG